MEILKLKVSYAITLAEESSVHKRTKRNPTSCREGTEKASNFSTDM